MKHTLFYNKLYKIFINTFIKLIQINYLNTFYQSNSKKYNFCPKNKMNRVDAVEVDLILKVLDVVEDLRALGVVAEVLVKRNKMMIVAKNQIKIAIQTANKYFLYLVIK